MARNLRRLRVRQGISQEALAVDSGIDRSYVGRLERAVENPTIGVLEKLTDALKVPVAELFVAPRAGEPAPRTLPAGRKPIRKRRSAIAGKH